MQATTPVLFYDGDCGLCARAVQWSLGHDHRRLLRFAPLQGSTYAAIASADKPRDLETMVVHDGEGLHVRSEAALRVLSYVGGPWRVLAGVARVCPRALRDAMYRFVANHRIAWFGTAERCDLPKPGDRGRFLP
jgi:predicted DCC family thiol-disulfide oxidoreductase YuxK